MGLAVSGAFHTPFMAPARTRLREALASAEIRDTDVAVIANVDALAHDRGEEWTALLSAQLTSPVRWKQCLQTIDKINAAEGSSEAVAIAELGPGGVLTGMAKRTIDGARTISVATPEDLDRLIEWIKERATSGARRVEGEHLFAVERLVVSPAAGVFTPSAHAAGVRIVVGEVIGHVGTEEVRSPFAGTLQSYIAMPTERVAPRQPIAWLRVD
jgi:[acyl-carrier-protein] S-malonyltransferase